MFKLTNISTILFITTAINLVVTIISWRRRDARAGWYFAWAMLAITCWTFASGLDYSATTIPLKILFAKFESLFYHCSLTLFVMFALAYSGYIDWLGKFSSQILLWSVTVINSLMIFTNEWHGLIWSGFSNNEAVDNVLIFHHGAGFLWIAVTNYIFILCVFFFLWKAMQSSSELTRRQSRFLIWATFFPIATNIFYLFEIIPTAEGVDWTALTFSVSGFLFLMALYGTRFLNIVPIAHHLIIERMPDCVLVLDKNNDVVDFNPAMQAKFGLSKKILGESIEKVMANWPDVIQFALSDSEPLPLEVVIEQPSLSVFDTRLTRLTDQHGHLYGKFLVFRNVTIRYKTRQELRQQLRETQELHEKVRYVADRDSLTHAYTRRYLYENLSEFIKSENSNPQFIVALLDIDNFKKINDQYGHANGDEILINLTKIMFAQTRVEDIVCRYGGEEFVIAMPNITMNEALLRLEQVRKNFQEFRLLNFNTGATISIGLAEYPTNTEKLDEVLNLADQSMYQAKRASGNQIITYSKQ